MSAICMLFDCIDIDLVFPAATLYDGNVTTFNKLNGTHLTASSARTQTLTTHHNISGGTQSYPTASLNHDPDWVVSNLSTIPNYSSNNSSSTPSGHVQTDNSTTNFTAFENRNQTLSFTNSTSQRQSVATTASLWSDGSTSGTISIETGYSLLLPHISNSKFA